MKSYSIVFAALSVALVACTAPQAPASAVQQAEPPASAAPSQQDAPRAKRAPGQENVDPLWIFRAFGTEPFWNVNVEGNTLTWATPEDQAGQAMQGERRVIEGGVEVTGNHAGKAFALTVTAGDCNDGMSDNQYQLVSVFRYGDAEFKGCGEQAR